MKSLTSCPRNQQRHPASLRRTGPRTVAAMTPIKTIVAAQKMATT